MPITESGFEYTIPKEVYDSIPDEFWNNFRHELYMICGLSLCEEVSFTSLYNGGTGSWTVAIYNACKKSNCQSLFDYYRSLEWYDSDIFDGIIADELIKRNLVKTYSLLDMARETIFDEDNILFCTKCDKPFLKSEMVQDNEFEFIYYCHRCNQCKKSDNEYYVKSNEELSKYIKNNIWK